ncbi:TBC domain containing protein [Tritrichomonas foetus]|uniref:TBC domain containing protein n=1 Tax=Tritrichomonas foetus TaxID=1144522 RepID=A0A1J4KNY5_9EUKA|nr:TBC domain containing protein [Tritrichomonas foetus]|eukprot:OHT11414.1 TBC domain containing protein [Tritrichomonas foetus]
MIKRSDQYNGYSSVYEPDDFIMEDINIIKRTNEWKMIIKSEKFNKHESREVLKSLVFQGIPLEVRGEVWHKFALVDLDTDFEYSDEICHGVSETADDIIHRDSDRTFAGSIGNERASNAKDKLIRILQSYAAKDPEIGYTQGMNFVASIPLVLTVDEKKTFWTFYGMMQNPLIGIRDVFREGLPGFFVLAEVWLEFVRRKYPWLKEKLENNASAAPSIAIARCFQSMLIAFSVPLELKMIMFDRLIIYGKVALVSFEMAVIKIFCNELYKCGPEDSAMFLMQVDKQPVFNDVPFIVEAWNEEWISNHEFEETKELIMNM